ncbi:PAS domain-containing protein [Microvirga sp. ACRRW]|uniref:PAS domain-containing protein n=1 Tax=Microvirga sp. ACRRW TaxID=2918205 RepID=UPI001EF5A107|nr:PAS domain-containing protein [Microvirga sp. ACRRW]MCG7392524.1 PAS domain-containing protein [Microvirga sp. ACRRW]
MALDVGKLGAWERDLETGEITGTPTFKNFFGLPPDALLSHEAFQNMIHPSDVDRLNQAIAFSLKTKTDFHIEHRIIRVDGRIGRVLVRGGGVFDQHSKPIRLMGVIQDVTERERIKEEISLVQRQQEFLSKLNEQIGSLDDPYAIMETSAKSIAHFLKVDNTGYGEVFEDRDIIAIEREWSKGLFSNEGRIEKISDLGPYVFGPLRQGMPLFTEDVLNDPWVRDDPEKIVMYKSVNVRTILTVPLLKNGRLVAAFYVSSSQPRPWPAEDISLVQEVADRTWIAIEKARANIRTREIEERLRMVTETFPALIWSVDPDLRLTYVNERWNMLMGRSPDQPYHTDWQSLIHPDDLAAVMSKEWPRADRQTSHTLEIRYLSPDGTYRWHLVRAVPTIGEAGEFKGWHGTSIDIHEYKLAKEADKKPSII